MKKKTSLTLTALLSFTLLLAGCGGSKSMESSDLSSSSNASGSSQMTASDWGVETFDAGYGEEASTDTAASFESAAPSDNETGLTQELSENDLSNRKLIKNVSLSFETEEFDTMKSRMEESIASFGGYTEYSSYDAPQVGYRLRRYSLTARIPADKLEDFVNSAGELGTLTNKSENVEDVTLDYVDKTAYKESLQVEYDRVTELLEKADDLDQVLALESKLSQLRYEINSYESQLRTYDNLISYSTVNIYISEVQHVTGTSNTLGSRISDSFMSSLYSVRDFFVDLFVFLIGNLPVLLLLAIAVIAIIIIIKRFRKKRGPKKHRKLFSRNSAEENVSSDSNTKE